MFLLFSFIFDSIGGFSRPSQPAGPYLPTQVVTGQSTSSSTFTSGAFTYLRICSKLKQSAWWFVSLHLPLHLEPNWPTFFHMILHRYLDHWGVVDFRSSFCAGKLQDIRQLATKLTVSDLSWHETPKATHTTSPAQQELVMNWMSIFQIGTIGEMI